ncbi:formate dehydrogenase accessory sulfurtransferase FdhD [soil metagenome]
MQPHTLAFEKIMPDRSAVPIMRPVADETPIAIEYNGLGYAVLMASAQDLEDLAHGFSLAERLVDAPEQIIDIDIHPMAQGVIVRITLAQDRVERVVERVRHRISESSCGLCGIENLEQALRPVPRVESRSSARDEAIFRALAGLPAMQPMNAMSGAVHGAALCGRGGDIRLVREDVGRHNAFDKLIGAMARGGIGWDGGFALLTSRCSYELVEKAALAGCPMLVTLSAPTGLAVERAREAGLRLVVLARPDAALVAVAGGGGQT